MMTARQVESTALIDRLPRLRGRLSVAAPLAGVTWFRVGGPVELLFKPADQDDLQTLLAEKPAEVPVFALGVGSNLLVRDGGIPGVTLRLGRAFTEVEADGEEITCGATVLDLNLATAAKNAGLGGLEFFSGIPGTLGGALRMNAGAYGRETKDVLIWAEALDAQGNLHRLHPEDLGYSYRHCSLPEDWIFLRARLRAMADDPEAIAARMAEIQEARGESQPIRSRTGGSTFKNPPGHKAWQLIDAAGCRGLTRGGAMVSEQHCNFLINTGEATAEDLEQLGEDVRLRVFETSGVSLEWEIRRIGQAIGGALSSDEEEKSA